MQILHKKTRSAAITTTTIIFLIAVIFSFSYKINEAWAACSHPAQILDLTNWKETLPIGSSNSPTEIKQTSLATYSKNPFFMPNASCDGIIFRAPVNGVTTSGSGYPRSELREMTNNGTSNASWSTTSGAHSMTITEAITAVPRTKKHVVAGQIHNSSDDVIVIRLEYPKLFVDINGNTGPTLDANYVLGKKFTVQFVATGGQIKIFYNGNQKPVYTLNKSGSGNYFKAGAYTQSNCSKETVCDSSNYGEVIIYGLKTQHQTSNSPAIAITAIAAPTITNTTPTPTTISLEAESGNASGGMNIVDDATSSGGKYVKANSTGVVNYVINVLESGMYRVAGWIKSTNPASDSFYISLDNKSAVTWTLPISPITWLYDVDDSHSFSLNAGPHIITIKYREAGAKLDKIMLIKQ